MNMPSPTALNIERKRSLAPPQDFFDTFAFLLGSQTRANIVNDLGCADDLTARTKHR